MEFTISRKTWLRGEGSDASMLFRPSDGKMCCLGFRACAAGKTAAQISGKKMPDELRRLKAWDGFVVKGKKFHNTSECCEISTTNDDCGLTGRRRETELKRLFRKLGDTVTFVD